MNTYKMKDLKKLESIIIAILLFALLILLINISLNAPIHRVGDSSTYYLQVLSITEDFDIQYQAIDIQRAISHKFDDLPSGLLLIKTAEGNYYYGKEFSYALFAAPAFLIEGNHGILIFNALMFWSMIFIGFLYLSKKGNSPILSLFVSLIFFILSTSFVYIFWIHVEVYNMFLITLGIFFWSLYFEDPKKDIYLIFAALIFGLATVAKLPNSLLFLPFLCYELYNQQFKRFKVTLLIFLVPIVLFYGYFYFVTGSMTFYGGNRLVYLKQFPFLGSFDNINESGYPTFSVEEGRISNLIATDGLAKSPINLFYFFFGRFTGMIWYYPLTVFSLLSLILGTIYLNKQNGRNFKSIFKANPLQYLALFGIALNIFFYVIIIGNNYLGGEHAIGNRYFYIFPAFLFLIRKIDLKLILPFIIISFFTIIPIISDPIGITQTPETHTFKFPYTDFPIEYSQINNLPIWRHQYTFSNYTLYDISGTSKYQNGFLLFNGSSELLIKTKRKINYLNVIIESDASKDSKITFESENSLIDISANKTENMRVDIPLYQPSYHENNYNLYKLNVITSTRLFIRPL